MKLIYVCVWLLVRTCNTWKPIETLILPFVVRIMLSVCYKIFVWETGLIECTRTSERRTVATVPIPPGELECQARAFVTR